jgi:hypothetical protein
MKSNPGNRKPLPSGSKVTLDLTPAERDLLLEHLVILDDLTDRLSPESAAHEASPAFTLDELHELADHVAAAANHAPNKKIQKQLDAIHDRIIDLHDSYTPPSN